MRNHLRRAGCLMAMALALLSAGLAPAALAADGDPVVERDGKSKGK